MVETLHFSRYATGNNGKLVPRDFPKHGQQTCFDPQIPTRMTHSGNKKRLAFNTFLDNRKEPAFSGWFCAVRLV